MSTNLPDTSIFRHFAKLNAVPRPSKHEERVIEFMVRFGESLHLPTERDAVGNVLIRKPASPGREGRPTVALQSHLDMVHQQNAGTGFDFATEGIQMRREGDWVQAEGTTLGADNGIGVATMMSVLAAADLAHGPLECLFTVDEETGMTGAKGLQPGWLKAKYLLNLDTEDDDELTIGCAGGVDVTARGKYVVESSDKRLSGLRVTVKGLSGGHSGMDIHKGLGNANQLLVRLLLAGEAAGLRLASFEGGSLRNALAREACAVISVTDEAHFRKLTAFAKTSITAEYAGTDPNLEILIEAIDVPEHVLPEEFQRRLLRTLQATPHGIWRMSPTVPNLVQTSNNLARVCIADGSYEVLCLTRSAVDSERDAEAAAIMGLYEMIGADVSTSGDYPGWAPRAQSGLLDKMRDLYTERFGESPNVNVVHAGLECGIIGAVYPKMEMVSFGPNIRGAHSPDERVQVSSVDRFWGYLQAVLAAL